MERGKKVLTILLPRLQDILFIATLGGAFLLGARMLGIDSDLGRHLTLGRYIRNTGEVPTKDLFSHTLLGTARPPYEWLTQVLFALANELAGLDGVILLVSLIIAATFTLVYMRSIKRSGLHIISLIITILAIAASSLHWLPRPHVVTFLFLAVVLDKLETIQRGERIPLWQCPILMLLWANMHGGFVFGFLAWLAYLAGWGWEKWIKKSSPKEETWRQLWSGFLLAGIASVITPDGWGNWKAVLSNHSRYILSQTVETMPVDAHQPGTWPFLFLTLLSIGFLLTAWKRVQASHVFLLAGLTGMGALMVRNIPLFAIAAAPILSLWTREAFDPKNKWFEVEKRIAELQKPIQGIFWPVMFGLGLFLFIGIRQVVQKDTLLHFDGDVFPVQATDWLQANPQSGAMFNEFNWGGYLLYRLWPEQLVFLDSQTDFYGEPLVREYEQVITASVGWEGILDRYEVHWVLLPRMARLAQVLETNPGWEIVYQDETAIIARKSPENVP